MREFLSSLARFAPAEPARIIVETPHIDLIDSVELPPIVTHVARYEAPRLPESVLDGSGKLERLTDKALDFMEEVLDSPTDYDEPKLVNAKISVAQTLLNTQTKVDETRLRRRQTDILPKLLEIMSREEKRLPAMIEGERA